MDPVMTTNADPNAAFTMADAPPQNELVWHCRTHPTDWFHRKASAPETSGFSQERRRAVATMWVAMEIVYSRNSVYQTAYHVVWCPKYRKRILSGSIANGLREMLYAICAERHWTILAIKIQPDHVHLFVSFPPSVYVSDGVNILKGGTARQLFAGFPEIKKQLRGGAPWSPSYYVGTAGNVSAATIRRYIERTEHIGGRR